MLYCVLGINSLCCILVHCGLLQVGCVAFQMVEQLEFAKLFGVAQIDSLFEEILLSGRKLSLSLTHTHTHTHISPAISKIVLVKCYYRDSTVVL